MNNRNEYIKRYTNDHYKRLSLNLHKENDKDIIRAIESEVEGNTQASIKSLIRKALR